MNNNSRVKNAFFNVGFAFVGQFVNQLMGFVVRTVFIKILNLEFLGVNGLFTNILSMLSLAELGVGSALIYSMYKPMAEGNVVQLKMYMNYYKQIYRVIGIAVLVIGASITPFLDFFIPVRPNIAYLEFIYILYVFKSVTTYFFAYKQSIFRAAQQQYVIAYNTTIFTFLKSVFEIVFLIVFRDFITYLLITIIFNYLQNIYIAILATKKYPFLKEKTTGKLTDTEKSSLTKNIGAAFLHRLGSVILNSTDNLILSKFCGLVVVGLYSNYSMIIVIVRNVFNTIFDGIVSSVGNLCAKEDSNKIYKVFNGVMLINIWGISFCSICLLVLINPFIEIWIGHSYLIEMSAVYAIIISFYIQLTIKTPEIFKTASGLFYIDRFVPIIQSVINLVVSILLVKKFGIAGIFIGTSVAMIFTCFWVQPLLVYRILFKRSVSGYYVQYIMYTMLGVISYGITKYIAGLVNGDIFAFLYKIICCCIIPNIIYFIMTRKTLAFDYVFGIVKNTSIVKRLYTNLRH